MTKDCKFKCSNQINLSYFTRSGKIGFVDCQALFIINQQLDRYLSKISGFELISKRLSKRDAEQKAAIDKFSEKSYFNKVA
ncbi:hypothetical protein I6U48_10755 [Clostridium sp. PL3]|uniref:Uncharacterized protein n=1 Tax=Clostridium thailandense TaxID=2794346 RepID=A0A949TZE9_9CLOT|nr:hypothetical protein [Clostridium thailandense]MBV7273389.1 hypothetical protein [Clostridium thailandense]